MAVAVACTFVLFPQSPRIEIGEYRASGEARCRDRCGPSVVAGE